MGEWMEIVAFVLLLVGAGGVAGVVAGLLGVGGGIVIVPALYYVLTARGYPAESLMHVCVATSLATIGPTSIRSLLSHNRKGAVDWAILRSWAPWLVIGAVLGAILADMLNTRGLMLIFGVLALFVAVKMAFNLVPEGALGDQPPKGLAQLGCGAGNGAVSALMGVGGGTFGVMLLTLYSVPIHRAVATSAGFGLLIAVPSMIAYIIGGLDVSAKPPFTFGYVNLAAFAIISPMTVLCAPIGVRLSHALNPKPLKMVFAAFLGITALNMLRKAMLG